MKSATPTYAQEFQEFRDPALGNLLAILKPYLVVLFYLRCFISSGFQF